MTLSSTNSGTTLQSDVQTNVLKKAIDSQEQQLVSLLDASQKQMQQQQVQQQQNVAKITGLGGNLNIMG